MEEFATRVFTVDNNSNQMSEVNNAQNLSSLKVQLTAPVIGQINDRIEVEIESKSKKFEKVNPNYSYIPTFYIKELKWSFYVAIIWGIILALATAACTFFVVQIIRTPSVNNWTLLTLIPIMGLAIALFIFYLLKYLNFNAEAKTINFKDEKIISNCVLKKYKSLRTGYITINWMSLMSYTIGLIALLVDCIICAVMYPGKFADVYIPIKMDGNYAFAVTFWLCAAGVIITFILQASLLLSAYIRYSRIENFYNVQLISLDELQILKKKTNRRDAFIYLAVVGTGILVVLLIVKLFKRKRQTKVVVNA